MYIYLHTLHNIVTFHLIINIFQHYRHHLHSYLLKYIPKIIFKLCNLRIFYEIIMNKPYDTKENNVSSTKYMRKVYNTGETTTIITLPHSNPISHPPGIPSHIYAIIFIIIVVWGCLYYFC